MASFRDGILSLIQDAVAFFVAKILTGLPDEDTGAAAVALAANYFIRLFCFFPEICGYDALIFGKFLCGAAFHDSPLFHHACAVSDSESFSCVLLNKKNGNALLVDILNDGKHFVYNERGQTERRLVEEEKLGVRHKASRDGEHLLLAAGKSAGSLLLSLFETLEHVICFLKPEASFFYRITTHEKILFNREVRENPSALRNKRNAGPHSEVMGGGERFAVIRDGSFLRTKESGDAAHLLPMYRGACPSVLYP